MQEIEYEDGTKTKEFFGSMFEALDDSKAKAAKKAIKKVTITKTTVKKREKQMPEVCTCKCGNQKWLIFAGYMKCVKCGKEYNLPDYFMHSNIFIDVSKFNRERDET